MVARPQLDAPRDLPITPSGVENAPSGKVAPLETRSWLDQPWRNWCRDPLPKRQDQGISHGDFSISFTSSIGSQRWQNGWVSFLWTKRPWMGYRRPRAYPVDKNLLEPNSLGGTPFGGIANIPMKTIGGGGLPSATSTGSSSRVPQEVPTPQIQCRTEREVFFHPGLAKTISCLISIETRRRKTIWVRHIQKFSKRWFTS